MARVPFDPKVAALGVAYFQMDLSSVVQEAQTVAAVGDIVEFRLLWVVSRIALTSEEPSPGDTGTISCLRTLSSGLGRKERLNKKCQAIKKYGAIED